MAIEFIVLKIINLTHVLVFDDIDFQSLEHHLNLITIENVDVIN